MQNKRKHKRFKLDVLDLSSKLSLIGKVDITDISLGGVALKADRRLTIGKECLLMLGCEGKSVTVKGVVVRSELSGIEARADGEKATIYSVGILFRDESLGKVKDFLDSIENNRKTQVQEQAGWFYSDFRFSITTPGEKVLNLLTQFSIKEISPLGVIILTNHRLRMDSMVLMELSVNAAEPASFMGKIVSCRMQQDEGQSGYDIGVEFAELTDRDRAMLKSLVDCIKDNEKRTQP
jgi:hypothetical protein